MDSTSAPTFSAGLELIQKIGFFRSLVFSSALLSAVKNSDDIQLTAEAVLRIVLEIPLTGGSTMVIFVPRPGTTFRHRITKLNYDRINRLFEMLTAHNIHYRVPKFEIHSSYEYGKDRKTHWFNFKWAGHYSRLPQKGLLNFSPPRDSYSFIAKHPFMFAIFENRSPVVMGIYTGR